MTDSTSDQSLANLLSEVAQLKGVLRGVRAVLVDAPQVCWYHGSNFDFLGRQYGHPRCDSCKQPERVVTAIADIDRMLSR